MMGAVGVGLVDCHCHLSAPDFDHDLDDVLKKAKKANVMALVVVAEHSGEFEKIMQLSQRYNGFVLPCLGVHPVQGVSPEDQRSVTLKDLDVALPIIENYKDQLLAIGEVGLDFSPRFAGTDEQKEEQRQVLIRQVQLAKRLNLPLNVHSRSAGRPTISLLNEQAETCETVAFNFNLFRNGFPCAGTRKTGTERAPEHFHFSRIYCPGERGLSGRSYRSDNTERVETVSQASAAAPEIASEQNHLQRAVFEKNKCPDKSQLQKPLEKYQDRDYN
ncbi:putative deoxyribonuclease TATDN3 isoform X3 [Bubalus kerabau]|uniref:putative deoxyribonuclease TATDN3 isoform X3 n=1 Tax=Bubalus carabanensis TaxID=3119969 RepID=UPI00244E939F|nr:putative deoxyribonuclease TATDN3 isoform X3 [Bubalus carabanensis]